MTDHTEFSLINRIQRWIGKPSPGVLKGVGDDTAVVRSPRGQMLATVDMLLEGVHFDLQYTIPQEVGHKALAVNLSDIASMGGKPLYALISLGLPDRLSTGFVRDLYRGIRHLAQRWSVDLIGGNIARSKRSLIVDLSLIGETRSKAVLRSGAKIGNLLAVTGNLGSSAAGLHCLRKKGRDAIKDFPSLTKAQLMPRPRIREATSLKRTGALTSMIDVSDGLVSEIYHLSEESQVGFEIDVEKIPMSNSLLDAAETYSMNPMAWALEGGEDYELLFTLKRSQLSKIQSAMRRLGQKFTVIGQAKPKNFGIKVRKANGKVAPLENKGWDHFSQRRTIKSIH